MDVPSESEFRAPPSAWVSAICSLFFVTIGLWIFGLLGLGLLQNSGLLPDAWMQLAAAGSLFFVPPLLGSVSAYQSFQIARRRAYQKFVASLTPQPLLPRWMQPLWVYPPFLAAGGALLGLAGFLTANPNAMGEQNFQTGAGIVVGMLVGWVMGALYLKFTGLAMKSRLQTVMRTCPACGESAPATQVICPLCGADSAQAAPAPSVSRDVPAT